VILAGDIGLGEQIWTYKRAVEDFLGVPVVQIAGNHDHYGQAFYPWKFVLAGHGIYNNHCDIFASQKVRILSATLWTDFACMGDVVAGKVHARKVMNDYKQIQGFTPDIAETEHWESRAGLMKAFHTPFQGTTIVVTHHSPTTAARNPNYPVNMYTVGFCSDANDLIDAAAQANVGAWVYGHDHWSQVVTKTPFLMVSAQMGYPNEKCNWKGPKIIEV